MIAESVLVIAAIVIEVGVIAVERPMLGQFFGKAAAEGVFRVAASGAVKGIIPFGILHVPELELHLPLRPPY